jgi:hypothetical protein
MGYETLLVKLGSKISGPITGHINGWWERRKLAKRLHTKLYRIIHDRPDSYGHSPRFYEKTADDLDHAIELELFSSDELEYLAGRLAAYCRAKKKGKYANAVEINKSFLNWTNVVETEGMHTFDVSEIEKRLREDLEKTYGKRHFEHPVSEEA